MLKSVGVVAMFVLAAIMRKMGSRLVDSTTRVDQLTLAQQMLLGIYVAVAVLTFAIPDFPVVSAAVEMCVLVLIVLSAWWDFTKFVLASNEAFGLVARAKKAAGIAKGLKRSMMVVLLAVHISFLIYVLFSSFWLINLPGVCDARSVDNDARHVVEIVRFYVCDVCHVVIVMSMRANVYVFKSKKKKYRAASAVSDGKQHQSWYVLEFATASMHMTVSVEKGAHGSIEVNFPL